MFRMVIHKEKYPKRGGGNIQNGSNKKNVGKLQFSEIITCENHLIP